MFDKDKKGVGREGLGEYSYLLMLMKLWPGDWRNNFKSIYMKVEEDNVKSLGMVNGQYQKVWRFYSNVFWKNIGFLVSAPTFGLEGSRMWKKGESINISGKKRNRR